MARGVVCCGYTVVNTLSTESFIRLPYLFLDARLGIVVGHPVRRCSKGVNIGKYVPPPPASRGHRPMSPGGEYEKKKHMAKKKGEEKGKRKRERKRYN